MKAIRVLFAVALMSITSSASAQTTMKKGGKAWTELEATLREANLKWLCQGKYFQPKRQDCVDARAKYWDDQFFEMNPGASGTQTKAQMVAGQTAGAKTYPDVVRGEGPNRGSAASAQASRPSNDIGPGHSSPGRPRDIRASHT